MSIYETQRHVHMSDDMTVEELMQKQYELERVNEDNSPDQTFILNLGPQHPSTHGVFRARLEMNGEQVVGIENHCGYLHRGLEKIAENRTWGQFVPYVGRCDYLSPILHEWCYCMAVEKLLGVEIPERGEYVRVILGELSRITHHLVYVASMSLDFNGYTPWMYMFREREKIFDILEAYSGSRMNNNALRIGGAPTPLPEGVETKILKWLDGFDAALEDFHNVISGNEIFIARSKNVGIIDAETCRDYGVYGSNIRAAGLNFDLRKAKPYSIYDRFDFEVPLGEQGDSYDRYMVRHNEMRESTKIVRQALEQMPSDGPTMGKVPKMLKVPAGSAYAQIEGGMGMLGYYVVSTGGMNPYRVRIHAPSMMNVFATPHVAKQEKLLLQDYIALLASIDIVLGEVDR